MSTTDSQRFHIYFAGECLPGFDEGAVRPALARLFKADAPTLDRLFSGQRQRIKRDCDEGTALKYQKAMAAAGARALVLPADDQARAPATPPAQAPSVASAAPSSSAPEAPATPQTDTAAPSAPDGLSLAPAGSDVLRPDERQNPVAADIALDHLSMAAPGERLSTGEVAAVPDAPAPDFQIADVGEHLSAQTVAPTTASPDTSAISLVEGELDLSDCAPPPVPPPSIGEGLSLADSGSELLNPEERRTDAAEAPDTSHLSFDADD